MSGVIEMDETFAAESFKGSRKKGNPHWRASRENGLSGRGAQGKLLIYDSTSSMMVLTGDPVREAKPF